MRQRKWFKIAGEGEKRPNARKPLKKRYFALKERHPSFSKRVKMSKCSPIKSFFCPFSLTRLRWNYQQIHINNFDFHKIVVNKPLLPFKLKVKSTMIFEKLPHFEVTLVPFWSKSKNDSFLLKTALFQINHCPVLRKNFS